MAGLRDRFRGRWRITEASTWDNDDLDLVEPAFIAFEPPGGDSEFRSGGGVATLDCATSQTDVGFTFHGSDEGDEVSGDGWAEFDGPDTIHGEIAFENGDDTTFKAWRREPHGSAMSGASAWIRRRLR